MQHYNELLFIIGFIVLISVFLVLDLGVFNKNSHIVSFKESIIWTTIWVMLSVGFYFVIKTYGGLIHGIPDNDWNTLIALKDRFQHPIDFNHCTNFSEALAVYQNNLSLEYLTGYLVEYSLSIDNVFVMVLIFSAFGVEKKYYKRVLFWGIIGALVLRFLFIFLSASLIYQFSWILYLFGGFLVFTGIKMFLSRNKEEKIDTQQHPVVKFATRFMRVYPSFVKEHFWVKREGKYFITPLLIVLLVIEFSDLIFAVDSVPAIFSISKDPYIVFFSNIFAIIGLRSLFFLVVNIIDLFRFLKTGLAVLLVFIGVKMLIHSWLESIGFTTAHSLYIILGILTCSILASLIFPSPKKRIGNV